MANATREAQVGGQAAAAGVGLLLWCSDKESGVLTVLEANACGTPVVARDVPGLSDSVQDGVTGLLVRRAHPTPLAAAITKLLLDEERRQQMAASALEWSRRFRWEPAAAAVLAAARRAVTPRRPVLETLNPVPSSIVRGRSPLDSGVLS
jgi:glycosyltransferase involved in cell wall biosynthesis